jgi:hypothetical protein
MKPRGIPRKFRLRRGRRKTMNDQHDNAQTDADMMRKLREEYPGIGVTPEEAERFVDALEDEEPESPSDMAQRLVKAIRDAVENYDGSNDQWYVDKFSVDCDAKELWRVIGQALREALEIPEFPRLREATQEELAVLRAKLEASGTYAVKDGRPLPQPVGADAEPGEMGHE